MFTATDDGGVRFHPLPAPTDEEVARVLATIATRVRRLLRRRGLEAEEGRSRRRLRRADVPPPRGRLSRGAASVLYSCLRAHPGIRCRRAWAVALTGPAAGSGGHPPTSRSAGPMLPEGLSFPRHGPRALVHDMVEAASADHAPAPRCAFFRPPSLTAGALFGMRGGPPLRKSQPAPTVSLPRPILARTSCALIVLLRGGRAAGASGAESSRASPLHAIRLAIGKFEAREGLQGRRSAMQVALIAVNRGGCD